MKVSIPFNREGVSERASLILTDDGNRARCVSIPFHRDGVSELGRIAKTVSVHGVFLFPSTGTAFLNLMTMNVHERQLRFLFPSTGTAFLN